VASFTDVNRSGGNSNIDYATTDDMPRSFSADPNLYNRAYSKLKEKIGERAAVGIALAEAHQSMEMISHRLIQMVKFTSAISRGRFGDASDALGLRKKANAYGRGRLRAGSKGFANRYLEYHFGWQPLLQDIYDSAEALSSPILPHDAVISVKGRWNSESHERTASGGIIGDHWTSTSTEQIIRMKCGVQVSNPNLALAQQLGLINPATIVWEKVPYSFVLDWFVNVADFLASYTDFAGLTLIKPHRTIFTRYVLSESRRTVYPPSDGYDHETSSFISWTKTSVVTERILGSFPGPELTVRRWKSPSPVRGLTAVSLLLQKLRKS
jgi:hypothetical protein